MCCSSTPRSDWKQPDALSLAALCVVLAGESLRKLAMWHAATNFNHHIRYRREEDHRLVTEKVYAWARHPTYVGWFWWCIATQVGAVFDIAFELHPFIVS